MTQFKDKAAKGGPSRRPSACSPTRSAGRRHPAVRGGPGAVGEDQRQHLELTRDLAQRFNHRFGGTFVLPDPYILAAVARIADLQDPAIKMSKSTSSPQGIVDVLDDPAQIRRKIARAVTDPGSEVRADDEAKPGVTNCCASTRR